MKKEFDTTQENTLQTGGAPKRRFMTKRKIIALSVVAAIILLFVWDIYIDPPAFWHFRQADKQAIVQYQRQNYPGAKVIERDFPFLANPHLVGFPVPSRMTFEYDGVKFRISAQDGIISGDGYGGSKIEKEIREKYLQDFFSRQGFSYEPNIDFSYHKNYFPQKDASLKTFRGSIQLDFLINYDGSKKFPEDYGWFYDFYCYWKEVCPTDDYSLWFCLRINRNAYYQLECDSKSEFADKDDFYNSFK